jgi:hypothetical protein
VPYLCQVVHNARLSCMADPEPPFADVGHCHVGGTPKNTGLLEAGSLLVVELAPAPGKIPKRSSSRRGNAQSRMA